MPYGVSTSDRQGHGRNVDRIHRRVGQVDGEGNGDTTAAGSQVRQPYPGGFFTPRELQPPVDEELRLWSRNQNALVHLEKESVKLLTPLKVSDRPTSPSFPEDPPERLSRLDGNRIMRVCVQRHPLNPQSLSQEKLDIEARFRNPAAE